MAEKKSAADDTSHARVAPSIEDRLAHIVGMMERLEWQRGKSAPMLAEQWGLAVGTVENDSAEASRRVTADASEVRRDITLGGRRLLKEALENGQARDFATIGKLLADVSGANAPQQHQFGTLDATPEGAARLVRERFGTHGAIPEKAVVPDGADGSGVS